MQQKSPVMTFDHLVKVCTDFYRKEEIIDARNLVDTFMAKRLPSRQVKKRKKLSKIF